MTQLLDWGNDALRLRLALHEGRAVVVGLDPAGRSAEPVPAGTALPPTEILVAGGVLPGSQRHVELGTTTELRYASHTEEREGDRSILTLTQRTAAGLTVTSRFTIFDDLPVLRVCQEVTNQTAAAVTLEQLASLALGGLVRFSDPDWHRHVRLRIPHNTTYAEFQWTQHTLPSLGVVDVGFAEDEGHSSKARVSVAGLGTQPTGEYLPMGALEDLGRDRSWVWQIETNGAWQWEVGDHFGALYLCAGGPNDQEHHWHRVLAPGESFTSVPVAIAVGRGRLEDVLVPLTRYRRRIRRPSRDNIRLPVVFSDYMNALWADPSEAKLSPVIAAAAAVGSEYYVVDAGWYADDNGWWATVGEWAESPTRFPNGLGRVFDQIRDAGMVPGLWIEPEAVGVDSPVVGELPPDAFFVRHGARVTSQWRHHLDFRSPAVRQRMDAVLDRLIGDYGLGYLKFDYNITGGIGTDATADSAGDGLLEHNRAFLAWLRGVLDRHPDLVIEDCASGGARADYATLVVCSIMSTSDQPDHRRYPPISAGAPSAVTPEQAGLWVYPQPGFGEEELRFAIVNGMLGRPQLSGGMWKLSPEQLGVVAEAMGSYRSYRERIPQMVPIWPIGLPGWYDDLVVQGLADPTGLLLAVWRRGDEPTVRIPLPHHTGISGRASVVFPTDVATSLEWDVATGQLTVTLPGQGLAARLIRLDWADHRT